MLKSLKECTTEELEKELKLRKEKESVDETLEYIKQSGHGHVLNKHVGISAEVLHILVESAKGNPTFEQIMIEESDVSPTPINEKEYAIHEAQEWLNSLKNEDEVDMELSQFYENDELICAITLRDIGMRAVDYEIDNDIKILHTLTKEENEQLLKNIMGESLDDVRDFTKNPYLVNARKIQQLVNEHIVNEIKTFIENR